VLCYNIMLHCCMVAIVCACVMCKFIVQELVASI